MDKQKEKVYLISSIVVCFLCLLMLVYYTKLPAQLSVNAMEQDSVSANEVANNSDAEELSRKAETDENVSEMEDASDGSVQIDSSIYERIVILDAGHGGIDCGAQATLGPLYPSEENIDDTLQDKQNNQKLNEKDLTLEIAKRVGAELIGKQLDVVYTRQDDNQIGVKDRCKIIKDKNACLTISIHADADAQHMRHGMVLYFNEAAQKLLESQGQKQSKVAQTLSEYTNEEVSISDRAAGDGVLIYDITTPAIQVNLGFLSNAQDGKILAREDYRKRLVKGLTEAILIFAIE